MAPRAESAADVSKLAIGFARAMPDGSPMPTALRSNRACRAGLADRIKQIMGPVTLITDTKGETLETPLLTHTWDPDVRGEFPRAVVEAVDGPQVRIDLLTYL